MTRAAGTGSRSLGAGGAEGLDDGREHGLEVVHGGKAGEHDLSRIVDVARDLRAGNAEEDPGVVLLRVGRAGDPRRELGEREDVGDPGRGHDVLDPEPDHGEVGRRRNDGRAHGTSSHTRDM